MKIYLAHNFAARDYLKESIVPSLEARGHKITSRWIFNDEHLKVDNDYQELSAIEDIQDIDDADALILFSQQYSERPARGKYVELGYALGRRKKVFVYGPKDCVFYYHPGVQHFYELDELIGDKL